MTTTYNPGNPFVEQRRQNNLVKLAETNPHVQKQLVENSEKDLIPNAIKWIKSREQDKKIYDSLNESDKQQMISNLINTWRIPPKTQPTNDSRFGGKRKTKKQRKHRKAGKSKKQRKTKTKTRKHRKAGKSKKQRKT